MSLQTRIDDELLAAIKSGDTHTRDILRLLKSALKNAAIDSSKTELTDEETINVITREAKKRRESIEAFEQANKPDLVEAEKAELALLEKYLPTQMTETEVRDHIKAYLSEHPTEPSQMGQAMGALSKDLKGQADLGLVSKILREELGS